MGGDESCILFATPTAFSLSRRLQDSLLYVVGAVYWAVRTTGITHLPEDSGPLSHDKRKAIFTRRPKQSIFNIFLPSSYHFLSFPDDLLTDSTQNPCSWEQGTNQ